MVFRALRVLGMDVLDDGLNWAAIDEELQDIRA
jgi:hypothetical protein